MLGLIRLKRPQGCSALQLLCRLCGRVGRSIGAGLIPRLLSLRYYLQALPVREVLTQVGLGYLVVFQYNRTRTLAQMQGGKGNKRPMQRRKQGFTHGETQEGAPCPVQA